MEIIEKFDPHKIAQVLEAYLKDGLSHRKIQREILGLPAPVRGGGFVVMEVLHHFNIAGDKKGLFRNKKINELEKTGDERFRKAIEIYVEITNAREEASSFFLNQDINKNGNPTESISEIKRRVYQDKLREVILNNYNHTCAICDINKVDLLVCSHIKPWAVDKNERLNPKNAICFCVLHDKMFDRGYFSLDLNYNIIFGSKADDNIIKSLSGLRFKYPKINTPDILLLKYHFEEMCM